MWKRSSLKEKAKAGVKRNYWKSVFVALISALIVGGVGAAGHFGSALGSADAESALTPELQAFLGTLPAAFWIFLGVFSVFVVAFAIFAVIALINPFNVGTYKYSLNAVRGTGNISDLGNGFDVSYKRNVKTMFFVDLYTFLWSLLFVIPGIIKVYEYRMIPYILADNPEIDKKEAFAMSKDMMKGNKWRAFVLDLSFILWDFLSSITLGLVGTFWVSPYKMLTNAALYDALKKN